MTVSPPRRITVLLGFYFNEFPRRPPPPNPQAVYDALGGAENATKRLAEERKKACNFSSLNRLLRQIQEHASHAKVGV